MKFAELIPQVFFDAIARVASGLILLASIAAIWSAELSPLLQYFVNGFKAAPATISMATIVVAYVLSFGFEGIRDEIEIPRKFVARLMSQPSDGERRKTKWDEAWKDFCKVYPNESMSEPVRPADAVAIDVLRVLNPAVGARIVKLRAEVALCRALSVGWTVLLLILVLQVLVSFAFPDLLSKSSAAFLFPILSVAVGARMIGNRQRSLDDRHLRALYNHWLLLVRPGAPGISDSRAVAERDSTEGPPALLISFDAVRRDTQLKDGGTGYRKLVVPEIYPSIEMIATGSHWQVPGPKEKGHVLQMSNFEVSIFSNVAPQKRHFHKLATEIYCVVDGEMDIEVNEELYILSSGDMIIVAPRAIHEVRNAGKQFLCQVIAANCYGRQDKYVVSPL